MDMVGLLPLLLTLGPDAPCLAAARFARIAWPCFGLDCHRHLESLRHQPGRPRHRAPHGPPGEIASFCLSGAAAAIHSTTRSGAVRGATGALGALAALGALLTGAVLVT